jgi:beta-glucosidase
MFSTAGVPRLRIPARWTDDGPHGVRQDVGPLTWDPALHTDDFSSYMPVDMCLASTWNPSLARSYGTVIGQEARARGKDIMLGPSVNIQRTPLCGRNFEYMGEDPYLTGSIASAYIEGVQSQGVASCVKHFVANNQETGRGSIDVEMDDRTLHEIYLPAFKAAVQQAGVLCVMGAYNQLRGKHCCESDFLLNQILKRDWGFTGAVISDWGGVHDTREAVMNGMDLEMGSYAPNYDSYHLAQPFVDGLQSGELPMSVLDDKVRRNLRVMFESHVFDPTLRPVGSLNTPEHQLTARKVAEEGIVLLKNEGELLPLDPTRIKSVVVIGQNAIERFASGGDSGGLKAFYEVTPLEGILRRAGGQVDVTFSMGYADPAMKAISPEFSGAAGSGTERGVGPDAPIVPALAPDMADRAVSAAAKADVAIVVAGLNHMPFFDREGTDRKDMKLPNGQDDLIRRIVQANPRTVVVLIGGAPVEMDPWIDRTPAVLQAWYPGMEGGNALAEILFGDVNPSGKLPCTFPRRLSDSPAHALNAYPGENGMVRYKEGLLVGYRWFDTEKIAPLFPFGHGLSYTQFAYSNLQLVPMNGPRGPFLDVQFTLTNTGSRAGAEVPQVYVHQSNPDLPRPEKELKGYTKVTLDPHETRTIAIPLFGSAFAYYDPAKSGWVSQKDSYRILVGSSSRDIRLQGDYELPATTVVRDDARQ